MKILWNIYLLSLITFEHLIWKNLLLYLTILLRSNTMKLQIACSWKTALCLRLFTFLCMRSIFTFLWTNSLIFFQNIALRFSNGTKSSNILTNKCSWTRSSYPSCLTNWAWWSSLSIRNRTMWPCASLILISCKLIIRNSMRVDIFLILFLSFHVSICSVR